MATSSYLARTPSGLSVTRNEGLILEFLSAAAAAQPTTALVKALDGQVPEGSVSITCIRMTSKEWLQKEVVIDNSRNTNPKTFYWQITAQGREALRLWQKWKALEEEAA